MDYAQSRFVLGTTGCELNGLIFARIRDERVLQKDFDSAFTKKPFIRKPLRPEFPFTKLACESKNVPNASIRPKRFPT